MADTHSFILKKVCMGLKSIHFFINFQLRKDVDPGDDDRYMKLIEKVCHENIRLVVDWMRFG